MTEILKFGLISDLHYADVDDSYNWDKTKRRFYRNAINLLQTAIKDWKYHNVKFILQLGDVIDKVCSRTENSSVCLDQIMDIFDEKSWSILSLVGNHELYNFEKEALYESRLFSNTPPNYKAYYTVEPHPGLKLCALNTFEISTLGSNVGSPEYQESLVFLRANPNCNKNDTSGLVGVNTRLCCFNGALSSHQLEWLKRELSSAEQKKQNVIVTAHNPVYPEAIVDESCLCWNYSEILTILSEYKTCVVCYISGHDHAGGHAIDENGIHHISIPGAIEHPDTYGIGCMHQNKIEINGPGDMVNVTCPLRFNLNS